GLFGAAFFGRPVALSPVALSLLHGDSSRDRSNEFLEANAALPAFGPQGRCLEPLFPPGARSALLAVTSAVSASCAALSANSLGHPAALDPPAPGGKATTREIRYARRATLMMKVTMAPMRNSTNRIFANPAAPAAIPPKPRNAAISATIRNTSA